MTGAPPQGVAPQGVAPQPPPTQPPPTQVVARDPLDPAAAPPSLPPRLRPRRAQSLAALLPMLGAFLLVPPFITVFAADASIFGVPMLLAYMLAVWVALIFGAWRLSGRLRQRLALSPGRLDPGSASARARDQGPRRAP
jgi:hypothetical protein